QVAVGIDQRTVIRAGRPRDSSPHRGQSDRAEQHPERLPPANSMVQAHRVAASKKIRPCEASMSGPFQTAAALGRSRSRTSRLGSQLFSCIAESNAESATTRRSGVRYTLPWLLASA